MPRLSTADRYAGLDIDYLSCKGKGRACAFDRSNIDADTDEDDDQHHSTRLKRVMRDFERSFCERDSLLDGWNDSDGDNSPLIYKSKFPCICESVTVASWTKKLSKIINRRNTTIALFVTRTIKTRTVCSNTR